MSELKIAVLSDGSGVGGVYNMLASFGIGLLKGFRQANADCDFITSYMGKSMPHICIGFNVSCHQFFDQILDSGSFLMLWSVDSVFYKNYPVIEKYSERPNFCAFSITQADIEPVKLLLPKLKYFYLPVGTDPDIWKDENTNKDYDLVFMSSINDYEAEIERLKQEFSPAMFKLFSDMYNYLLSNPDKNIWEAFYQALVFYKLEDAVEADFYSDFFTKTCYIITYARRVELVKSLEDIGVKIWGSPEWTKYISGRNEYMGSANFEEAVKITQKSKIVLHQHPIQVANGIHDRIINASSAGAFVVSSDVPAIKDEFKDSILYYSPKDYEKLKQEVNFYLANDGIRKERAAQAREISIERHTWQSRAKQILSMVKT